MICSGVMLTPNLLDKSVARADSGLPPPLVTKMEGTVMLYLFSPPNIFKALEASGIVSGPLKMTPVSYTHLDVYKRQL